ncbi:MAG: YdjY domain-containing protein [Planctomycetota bacterium]|nr:YdjY domain-containing protein [Planctomycetota bacterium]MDA1142826.1 YdjY domain-containing protein [Planctomycetota bacterium]
MDLKKKRVEVQGNICLDQGLIEYLACARGGKEHESLLVMDCKPHELFLALQTLGLRPGKGVDFQGEQRTPSGDKVYLYLEYKEDDKVVRHRVEDLVWDIQAKKTMERTPWIFVGSKFLNDPDTGKPIFMAQLEGNIIATYHDPYAIFDHPLDTGADDTFYHTNEKLVPQVGTPIKLIILREELKEKEQEK